MPARSVNPTGPCALDSSSRMRNAVCTDCRPSLPSERLARAGGRTVRGFALCFMSAILTDRDTS